MLQEAVTMETRNARLQEDNEEPTAISEVERKTMVKLRWINAINKVRDQISQVSTSYFTYNTSSTLLVTTGTIESPLTHTS